MKSKAVYILSLIICLMLFPLRANAQFKEAAFSQNYSTDESDTTSTSMFSIKEYFRGLAHKDTLQIGTAFAGSTVFIGGQQIYNKDYWKLPIVYGGLGATLGLGFHYKSVYNKSLSAYNSALELDPLAPYSVNDKARTTSRMLLAGGAMLYWATLMDGVISYVPDREPLPGKATLYSLLCPGLGQVYNGEYWKVPIYWGGLLVSYHCWDLFKTQYKRFKGIYLEANDPDVTEKGPISGDNAKYYRDVYRRYRDYSVLAIAAVYLIQVIDANVFSYMQDFEVNDDLSMHIRPTVLTPDFQYACAPVQGFGMSIGFTF